MTPPHKLLIKYHLTLKWSFKSESAEKLHTFLAQYLYSTVDGPGRVSSVLNSTVLQWYAKHSLWFHLFSECQYLFRLWLIIEPEPVLNTYAESPVECGHMRTHPPSGGVNVLPDRCLCAAQSIVLKADIKYLLRSPVLILLLTSTSTKPMFIFIQLLIKCKNVSHFH